MSPTTVRCSAEPPGKEGLFVRIVGAAAFVLLAAALCARPLLQEDRSSSPEELVVPAQLRSGGSLVLRHLSHLMVAGGIGLAAAWVAMSRKPWRPGGLEAGALVLVGGALLAVPAASDKRLAMNAALDTILPLMAAAALYPLLTHCPTWRRALLAALVAVAAANCCKATAQRYWEYPQRWDNYQRQKAQIWSQRGIREGDPEALASEAAERNARPMGFIQGANVLSSFLLLGLAGTGAALAVGWWRRTAQQSARHGLDQPRPAARTHADSIPRSATALRVSVLGAAALSALAAWHLVALSWTRTAGSMVGLLAALAAGVAAIRLRDRPRRLAFLLAGGLVLLQAVLVGLALAPPDLHRALLDSQGAGGNMRTLGARLCYWDGAIRLFAANPLTGIGPSHFGKHYLVVRPAYSNEAPPDAHNWLLNVAAEWGMLGVLGVVIAAGAAGWTIVRGLSRPACQDNQRGMGALAAAIVVLAACWLIVGLDLPAGPPAKVLPYPVLFSIVAAALVSLSAARGRFAQGVLLGGLVGFVVHCAAEITPTVPGVMWPFGGLIALAMAWPGPAVPQPETPAQRRLRQSVPVLAGTAALVVIVLTIPPLRAVMLMHQAQRAVAVHYRPQQALGLLQAAAVADPLDPLPLRTAAYLRYGLAQVSPARAAEHHREYVALSAAALQRSPLDYALWETLAQAKTYLAVQTGDPRLAEGAVRDMQKALERNPRWPQGWLELAKMAAVGSSQPGRQTALLRDAIEATNTALALEDNRPREVPPTLSARDRAELLRLRDQLSQRLQALTTEATGTMPSR